MLEHPVQNIYLLKEIVEEIVLLDIKEGFAEGKGT